MRVGVVSVGRGVAGRRVLARAAERAARRRRLFVFLVALQFLRFPNEKNKQTNTRNKTNQTLLGSRGLECDEDWPANWIAILDPCKIGYGVFRVAKEKGKREAERSFCFSVDRRRVENGWTTDQSKGADRCGALGKEKNVGGWCVEQRGAPFSILSVDRLLFFVVCLCVCVCVCKRRPDRGAENPLDGKTTALRCEKGSPCLPTSLPTECWKTEIGNKKRPLPGLTSWRVRLFLTRPWTAWIN